MRATISFKLMEESTTPLPEPRMAQFTAGATTKRVSSVLATPMVNIWKIKKRRTRKKRKKLRKRQLLPRSSNKLKIKRRYQLIMELSRCQKMANLSLINRS